MFRMTILSKSVGASHVVDTLERAGTSKVVDFLEEIVVSKDDDEDSPDFPMALSVSNITLDSLIDQIKSYLKCGLSISSIVKCDKEGKKFILNSTKQLPKESKVKIIEKRGDKYILMTEL